MNKTSTFFALVSFLSLVPTLLNAQTAVDVSRMPKHTKFGGALVLAKVDYKPEEGDGYYVERKILAGEFAYSLNPKTAVIAELGYIFESKFEDGDDKGSGFMFGSGAEYLFYGNSGNKSKSTSRGKNRVKVRSGGSEFYAIGYGFFDYLSESFSGDGYKIDQTIYDLYLGAVATYNGSKQIKPYVGLELIPMSSGSAKYSSDLVDDSANYKRESIFNIKLGASMLFGDIAARLELIFGGEQTFVLGGNAG